MKRWRGFELHYREGMFTLRKVGERESRVTFCASWLGDLNDALLVIGREWRPEESYTPSQILLMMCGADFKAREKLEEGLNSLTAARLLQTNDYDKLEMG